LCSITSAQRRKADDTSVRNLYCEGEALETLGVISEDQDMSANVITPIATVIVAGFVALISFLQWRISREKLRLDLYNRRFDIYTRVLDYYQELLKWHGTPEQLALQKPFIKAVRESRFIFPEDSGVYKFLEEFSTHAFYISSFAETRDALAGTQEQVRLALARTDHVNWILKSMSTLEDKMSPCLRFDSL
jgi:hypothetical protein